MYWVSFLIKMLFLSQIIRIEEGVDQAGPSGRPKQAKHGRGPATVLQASKESGLFILPIAQTVMFAREHLGQTGRIWRKKDHCDYECCKNKMSSEELCFETREKNDNSFHIPCDNVSQQMKYLVFIFLHMFQIPFPRLNKSYLFLGYLRMLNGSAVCRFWVL